MAAAMIFHAAGQRLERVEVPPRPPQGGEIAVRILCCTLCKSDLQTFSGNRNEATPTVLGHEVVGRIIEFGPQAVAMDSNGEPARVGDRISWAVVASCGGCFNCRHDLPQKCDTGYKYGHRATTLTTADGGGLAERMMLRSGTAWFRVPESIPDAVAAIANCATATVSAMLRTAGALKQRSILILGAGTLGLTASAMAAANGATAVIVVDPSEEARERALRFGATHVLAMTDLHTIHEWTHGRGVDVAFELAGNASSVQSALQAVRTGGTVVLAGTVSPTPPIPLDAEQFVRRQLTLHGVHNYHPRDLGTALAFLAGDGASYPFASLIAGTFALDEADAAFRFALDHPGVRVAVTPLAELS
ncbi:zinc-binding dehydrogenase [soil metagenome]